MSRLKIVYSPRYNMGFFGLERLHPFDTQKYARAWKLIRAELGAGATTRLVVPQQSVAEAELLRMHTKEYLAQLREPKYVSRGLELPIAARLPRFVLDWCVLHPMRWATAGTILAARLALEYGLTVNLGGGFHHAKPTQGEGFCLYSDIGLAVTLLRDSGALAPETRVAYVDLDAHLGNGVAHVFRDAPWFFHFDMFHDFIYPWTDRVARDRVDCLVPLASDVTTEEYLERLQSSLPGFLDNIAARQPVGLAIYNAGTDIVEGDPLGQLRISPEGSLRRDLFVIEELRKRKLPTVMVLSGGYTRESYRLVARSIIEMMRRDADL